MSFSEDEDDFQSADEDGFNDDERQTNIIPTSSKIESPELNRQDQLLLSQQETVDKPAKVSIDKTKVIETSADKPENSTSLASVEDKDKDKDQEEGDEEALAERIRERNLKIARKFSMEIAKNIKPSAPIPVQASGDGTDIGFKVVDDTEYPNISDPEVQSSPPPAPPPTPALSSSYNSEDTFSQPSSGSGTQYGWRISPKIRENQQESAQITESSKSEQARAALDKLSETLPQSEKSLLEKIAEDVIKVRISTGEPEISDPNDSKGSSTIPLFPELSSPFRGWNWNGASDIRALASQMTSQVGSVLDSVVGNSQNLQKGNLSSSTGVSQETDSSMAQENSSCSNSLDVNLSSKKSQNKAAMSANEASSNDALVDFTLNAMESLGKRAFGVMTERDESGALQIKGLGRPWEHLLNKKKEQEQSSVAATVASDTSNPPVEFEILDKPEATKNTVCYDDIKKIERVGPKTTLTNRRKRLNYSDDDDKLD